MWKDLTLKEKAEIMKMSVANGVTDINDIQQLYDDSIDSTDNSMYAEGGHMLKGGGPEWSSNPASMIEHFEGFRESPYRDGTAWSVGYGQYKNGYGANLDWDALLSGKKKLTRSEAHQQVLRTITDLKKKLKNTLGEKLYNSLTPGQLMGYLDTGYQRPASMIQAAQVHRTKGAAAAASVLGVNGFADRNAARRAAFTGNWDNYTERGNKEYTPNKSTVEDYSRQILNTYEAPAFQPITLNSANVSSPWLDYISKIGQQRPVSFNTPIGTSNNLASNSQINVGPVDFSNIGRDDELMSFVNPYTSKQAIEYNLGLENNALWNSPYLLFNAHSAANGGHIYRYGTPQNGMHKLRDFELDHPNITVNTEKIKRAKNKIKLKVKQAKKNVKKSINDAVEQTGQMLKEDMQFMDALAGAAISAATDDKKYVENAKQRLNNVLGLNGNKEYKKYIPLELNPNQTILANSQIASEQDIFEQNEQYLKSLDKDQLKELQDKLYKAHLLSKKDVDGKYGQITQNAFNKYNSKYGKWNSDVSTNGIDGCAQWVTLKYENATGASSTQNGVVSNAWQMLKNIENHGGTMLYNIYDDSFNNLSTHKEVNDRTENAVKNNPIDYTNLNIGDVVGIYMPSSDQWEIALKEGTTKNTHVGIITGFDKEGEPIVEHNIHGKKRIDPISNIGGSAKGTPLVTAVARPNYTGTQVKQLHWDPKKSIYTVDEKYNNAQLEEYMNSMAGISDQIQKLYPGVNMEDAQLAAISILKRETNFMNNKTSDQSTGSQIKEAVGNVVRSLKGMTDETKSSDLSKLKLSTLSPAERQLLGIYSKDDLENPTKAGAAALMVMARNMDYFNRLSQQYPDLGITSDDIYNATVLSYNQGMDKLMSLGFNEKGIAPEELEQLRELSNPSSKIKDVNSSKYKYLGAIGEYLYDELEDPYTPYIAAANDAASRYVKKNGEYIPVRANVNPNNIDYVNKPNDNNLQDILNPQFIPIAVPTLQELALPNFNVKALGGHLYDDGSMLIKNNAVNPALQYVYGPEYEEIVRQRRNWRPNSRINVQRSKPKYDIEARGDVITNTVRPTQRVIRRKQTSESPARRAKEQQRYDAMMTQYRNERQGTISQAPNRLRHPDYDPVKANQVQQRYEQNEIAEQKAHNRRVLEHNILEGMEAIPWPSTVAGAWFNPNTHWYDPGSFFTNLYANDNRGFFNYNQATRDFYDANPEVGSVANLIGDFVVPGAAAKVLKGASRLSKFAAADIGNSWKTMRYGLAHPESQTYGIIPNNFNPFKLNNGLRKLNNKLDNTALKIGNVELELINSAKSGINKIKSRISNITNSITNKDEQPILKRVKDYGTLSDNDLNLISYQEAMDYPQFVDYSFANSSSLHPNFPAGTTRREIMEAMANVENGLASRPRFATSEFLGHDFSAQSVQMILNKIDKIQKKLIQSGEQPGIISYEPGAKSYLNPFAEINYGTKEAPINPFTTKTSSGNYKLPYTRATQEYTLDDMARWSDIQSTIDAITKRLQKIYDNVAPYNEVIRNVGRDVFKAEVLPNGRILVPSIGFLFKDGGEIRI